MAIKSAAQELQDTAAGGHERRFLLLPSGEIVRASVAIRPYMQAGNVPQMYGYLEFRREKKTTTKYIGVVSAASKEESIKLGWKLAREKQTAEKFGWQWVDKPET